MKTIQIGLIAIVLARASCVAVFAQEVRSIGLDEAVKMGIDNSKLLKIAVSKSDQAEAYSKQMKNNMLPEVKASGSYLRINSPKFTLDQQFSGSGSTDMSGFNMPHYLMYGMATASMPLFSGFKLRNGLQSSQYLEEASKLDVETQRNEVVINIVEAYINLYKAKTTVDLVEDNLDESKQRVEDFSNMEKNGLLTRNDLLEAQLLESNTSLALLDAENNHRVSNYNMNLLLGIDESTELDVDSLATFIMPEMTSLEDVRAIALSEREDLQAQAKVQSSSESMLKMAKGDYYPTIALSGGYVAANFQNIFTVTNALNAGIGISYNLSNLYKNSAKIQQSKEQYLQSQLMYNELSDQVKREVFQAYTSYEESIDRIAVYEKAQEQATESYRMMKEKHENSLATTTDLLNSSVAKFQADLNVKYAKVDAVLAYYQLLKASGQLDQQWQQ